MSPAVEAAFCYRAPSGSPPLDLFGLWQSRPSGGVSFEAGSAPGDDAAGGCWQVDLPAETERATEFLRAHQARLDDLLARLDTAPLRAQAVLAAAGAPPAGGVAFETAASPGLPAPEANLLAGLRACGSGGATSFAAGEGLGLDWDGLKRGALDLLENARRQLLYAAWVETAQEGQVLARSTVDWLGDLQTTWRPDFRPEQAQLHHQSLRLALQARAATLKTAATLAALAARIVMLFSLSGGLLAALSLAWKFIQDISS